MSGHFLRGVDTATRPFWESHPLVASGRRSWFARWRSPKRWPSCVLLYGALTPAGWGLRVRAPLTQNYGAKLLTIPLLTLARPITKRTGFRVTLLGLVTGVAASHSPSCQVVKERISRTAAAFALLVAGPLSVVSLPLPMSRGWCANYYSTCWARSRPKNS